MAKEINGESYKSIPEKDMEGRGALYRFFKNFYSIFLSDEAVRRPKSLVKLKSDEKDGADEKMLADDEKKLASKSEIIITEYKNDKQNGDAKLDIGEYFLFVEKGIMCYKE